MDRDTSNILQRMWDLMGQLENRSIPLKDFLFRFETEVLAMKNAPQLREKLRKQWAIMEDTYAYAADMGEPVLSGDAEERVKSAYSKLFRTVQAERLAGGVTYPEA
jgi:hypothetical protein